MRLPTFKPNDIDYARLMREWELLDDRNKVLERENAELRKKFMFAESEIILLREDREELRELAARMAKEMREIDHEFCSLADYDNLQNKI